MEGYMGMKLKRKDLDEVNDDFSDFSLSAPARKIRRLDAELPPIIEEEEAEIPVGYEQMMVGSVDSNPMNDQLKPPDVEELPFVSDNEEKAIVVFKPVNNPLLSSPSNYSVDPYLISSFKNQALLGTHVNTSTPVEEDETARNGNTNSCTAVIPWVASQGLDRSVFTPQPQVSEAMDTKDMETETMDIEDVGASNSEQQYTNHMRINEPLQHQWQQQLCSVPQPPENTITPIVWYR